MNKTQPNTALPTEREEGWGALICRQSEGMHAIKGALLLRRIRRLGAQMKNTLNVPQGFTKDKASLILFYKIIGQ